MGIQKDKLIYDGTTTADGDSVAAFLHASGGKLTSTNVSGKEALDVNMVNEIAVAIDGIYAGTTNENPDNVGLIGHTRAATPGDADQVERTTVGAPTASGLVAANIHALDTNGFLHGFNGTTWDRLLSASGSLQVKLMAADSGVSLPVSGTVADDATDSGNPVKVGSRAVGAALPVISAAGDRADLISDLYRRIFVNDSPDIALLTTNKAVSTTGVIVAAALAGRRRVLLQNLGSKAVYIGPSGVTNTGATKGLRIAAGANMEIPLGEHVALHAVAESGTQELIAMEIA